MKWVVSILISLSFFSLQAQDKQFDLTIESEKAEILELVKPVYHQDLDSNSVIQLAKRTENTLRGNGYLLSEGQISFEDTTAILYLKTGKKLNWGKLKLSYPDSFLLPEFSFFDLSGEVVSPASLAAYTDQYLRFLENRGYPFATAQFNDKRIEGDTLYANLYIEPGSLIRFDSITVKGYNKFSENVLRYDLGFKRGMLYSEAYLKKVPELIRQVEYLRFSRNPAVAFQKDKTTLYLYTEEVKSNQIDGVIGLNTAENGDVSFNGDFQLRLLNTFKTGEEIKARWRRPDDNVQSLNIGLGFAYLFRTPFWLEADLEIFRQDSSFVNTRINGILKYLLEGRNFVSGGIDYISSNVLTQQAEGVASDLGSFNTVKYKLGAEINQTDRILVPTKGNYLKVFGFSGTRNTAAGNQQQYGWEIEENYYWQLSSRHVMKFGLLSASLYGSSLFLNELYRIGGLKTLRGFNEQSIFSSAYGIGTLEYRYMIGEFDYLTVFSDLAYSELNSITSFTANTFVGIGAGINFRTAGGIFSLFYALGRDNVNPFDFRTSKIHFGYVNRF